MRVIILLFFSLFLFGNEKLVIAKFENLKPYYYNHQIVDLKLKIITISDSNLRVYDDYNNTYPIQLNGDHYISDIRFELNNSFPIIHISLDNNSELYETNITINSQIKNLYPPRNFCNILADEFNITDTIITKYDDKYNMIYWTLNGKNANLKDFTLHLKDEKLYSLEQNGSIATYSYSALIPIRHFNLKFSYFNLQDENYKSLNVKMVLKNETISTQTDIKPIEKNNIYIIDAILAVFILILVFLYIYKKGWGYIVLIVLILIGLIFLNLPKKEIILKEGTKIHVLPFKQSTVFVVLAMDTKVKVLNEKNGYKKVEFNKYIGWVKDE